MTRQHAAPPFGFAQHWIALCVILFAAFVPTRAGAAPAQSRVAEIMSLVRKQGDKTPHALYEELGAMKSASALDALERALDEVKARGSKRAVFHAMRHFLETDDLGKKALNTVERYARSSRATEANAAAGALAGFGPKAYDAMFDVARSAKEPIARAHALGGLRPELVRRADMFSLEVVLDAWITPQSGTHEHACQVLRAFKDADSFSRMTRFLGAKKSSYQLRQLIVVAMGGHPRGTSETIDEGVDDVLTKGVQSKGAQLRYYALQSMARRGGTGKTRLVERLADDRDPAVRRAALLVLLRERSRGFDPFELARDEDSIARQAAAITLAEDGSPEAIEALHDLLADEDFAVRGEAIRQAGRRRAPSSIPALIDRLAAESGRLRGDVHHVLTLMTGKDLGFRVGAWRSFWRAEGETFEMPTYEAALKIAEERATRKTEGNTRVAFYGLEVISNRFALVIDTSGSMTAEAYAGKTRLDIAKEQLTGTLKRTADGVLFNVVPFAGGARPMEDGLIEMDDVEREDSMLFVSQLRAGGNTNVYDALAAAFDDERIDTIYLLTDGDPSVGEIVDGNALREEVARWNSVRGVRIHCIAVGKDSSLLRGLAEDSGGKYVRVE